MGLVIFCHAGSDNGVPEVDDDQLVEENIYENNLETIICKESVGDSLLD